MVCGFDGLSGEAAAVEERWARAGGSSSDVHTGKELGRESVKARDWDLGRGACGFSQCGMSHHGPASQGRVRSAVRSNSRVR